MDNVVKISEKGKYYRIIKTIMGCNEYGDSGVKCLYKKQVRAIFETIPHYVKEGHVIDIEEFKFSFRWVLADMFGDGCEVEEPKDLFNDIK